MCTVLVAHGCLSDGAAVVVANRDEDVNRPSGPPETIGGSVAMVIAGRDLLAGGTWLGVNQHGLMVGITNGPRLGRHRPELRSRGHVTMEALRSVDGDSCQQWMAGLDPKQYNPFNLIAIDPARAWVAISDGRRLSFEPLKAGFHSLSVFGLDAVPGALGQRLAGALEQGARPSCAQTLEQFVQISKWHKPGTGPVGAPNVIGFCHHGAVHATVCSSRLVFDGSGVATFEHLLGRPCEAAATELSLPWLTTSDGVPTG